ncbi:MULTISPECIES: hypothetical protein [Paenibacillus]|uniref:hypothetical protein n=1 Tax=Paenibacillus TaxID=44249 RepID=UPI0022B8BEA9|nr:hypothetical protein [Paenibacillus caseinilyticus]MCZ8519266.1 hypothetical protein [Paenibacillus caseinilyticus]
MQEYITMAEALSVRAAISRRMQSLMQERMMNSTTVIEKGEQAEYPTRTVDLITEELEKTAADYRTLDVLIAKANITHTIRWNDRDLTVLEAIELAKQTRAEINMLIPLGSNKKIERHMPRGGHGDSSRTLFTVALYDPEAYSRAAQKKEREAVKLSSLIEQSNHAHKVPFDASAYMG